MVGKIKICLNFSVVIRLYPGDLYCEKNHKLRTLYCEYHIS